MTLQFNPRFGFGRYTTVEEVEHTAAQCIKHVGVLRDMSPLWEMVQVRKTRSYNSTMFLEI